MTENSVTDKNIQAICKVVTDALEEMKAENVLTLDVQHLTSMTDWMVIASGGSDRHVKSLAHSVIEAAKESGNRPIGSEGEEAGEWVLVDLNGVIVHIMQKKVRDFYEIEKLWNIPKGELQPPENNHPLDVESQPDA